MHGYVLFSGGIDSRTCLQRALDECEQVTAVSIDYGQRHKKEVTCALQIVEQLREQGFNVSHKVISIGDILGNSRLTDASATIPDVSYDELEGVSPTYVPFRNGTMLSVITALADSALGEHTAENANSQSTIYIGTHAEDSKNWAYPDCTPEFIGAMANAIFIGTYQRVRLCAPLLSMNKADIIRYGESLPNRTSESIYKGTWSCYKGEEVHCGTCPTCRSRRQGFEDADVNDPTEYAQ